MGADDSVKRENEEEDDEPTRGGARERRPVRWERVYKAIVMLSDRGKLDRKGVALWWREGRKEKVNKNKGFYTRSARTNNTGEATTDNRCKQTGGEPVDGMVIDRDDGRGHVSMAIAERDDDGGSYGARVAMRGRGVHITGQLGRHLMGRGGEYRYAESECNSKHAKTIRNLGSIEVTLNRSKFIDNKIAAESRNWAGLASSSS